MALATTTLFNRLGRIFKHAEFIRTFQATLATQHTATVGQYSGAALEYVGLLSRNLESRKVSAQATNDDLLSVANRTLIELADANYNLVRKDVESSIREVIRQMIADSDDVDGNSITVGSVAAGSANTGNGTLVVSGIAPLVDKYGNRPGNLYLQNAKTETLTADCVSDSTQRAVDEGSEKFRVYGQRAVSRFDEDWPTGSGRSQVVSAVTARTDGGRKPSMNVTSNGDFEQFTSNTPNRWTVAAGTPGSHILAAGAGYNGSNALKFVGDGSTTPSIYQRLRVTTETLGQINPDRPYTVSFAVKYAVTKPTVTMTVAVEDSGGTRLSNGLVGRDMKAEITNSNITTSYQLVTATCWSPVAIPKGSRIVVEANGNMANTSEVFIDDVCVAQMRSLGPGSPHVQMIAGSDSFAFGDTFTRAVTNNLDGTVAKEMDRFFDMEGRGLALPGDIAGGESIADSVFA